MTAVKWYMPNIFYLYLTEKCRCHDSLKYQEFFGALNGICQNY